MNKALNKEILKLALPSVLANITVPLVGMVDTAISGHLISSYPSATIIGAISVGSVFFSLLYWGFSFLRTGTSGLTSQALGRRDTLEANNTLVRSIGLAFIFAILVLSLQTPFIQLVTRLNDASDAVKELAMRYFYIRVWAAPATLMLTAYRGWFIGMQDSISSMWADLIINISNICISLFLTFGAFGFNGIGFDGIALGTVIAQYLGFTYCVIRTITKYHFGYIALARLKEIFINDRIRSLFKLNLNLFWRSIFLIIIYYAYTIISAGFGDLYLSCGAIMMQLLMLFSYFTDGFAYAGEALTGLNIGAKNKIKLRESIRYCFFWSISVTILFIAFYALCGVSLLKIMTEDSVVIEACKDFLPWLLLMPPFGCAAFFWDGIFIGATESVSLRRAMGGSMFVFIILWYIVKWLFNPVGAMSLHLLLACYFAHLIFRTIYLSIVYKPVVLSKL